MSGPGGPRSLRGALQPQRREIAPAHHAAAEADSVEILRDGAVDHGGRWLANLAVGKGYDLVPAVGARDRDHRRGRVEVLIGPERPADPVLLVQLAEAFAPLLGALG